jgi:AcrR family transcriptional regulator
MSDLRDRILIAAQELFRKHGPRGVSMRRIADSVGVTATAIYRHFENKNDLVAEIIRSGLVDLQESLAPALRAEKPADRLRGLALAYLDFALEKPETFELAFGMPGEMSSDIPGEIEAENWMTFGLALEQIDLCMEHGVWRRDDPVETAILIWSTIHGLITLYGSGRLGVDEDGFRRVYEHTLDRLFGALEA